MCFVSPHFISQPHHHLLALFTVYWETEKALACVKRCLHQRQFCDSGTTSCSPLKLILFPLISKKKFSTSVILQSISPPFSITSFSFCRGYKSLLLPFSNSSRYRIDPKYSTTHFINRFRRGRKLLILSLDYLYTLLLLLLSSVFQTTITNYVLST